MPTCPPSRCWFTVAVLSVAAALPACSGTYLYAPATHATGQVAGRLAAEYEIPTERPTGDVRVGSLGITEIAPQGAPEGAPEGEKVRAMHVRMDVLNNSDQPWTLDVRNQVIAIAGGGTSPPAFASAPGQQLPMVTIAPKAKQTIDLFYPLPPGLQKASRIPEFDAIWQIQTDQRGVLERTPFNRLQIEPVYAYGYDADFAFDYGLGPWGIGPWWYNSGYPIGPIGARAVLPKVYVEKPVYIGRPHWTQ